MKSNSARRRPRGLASSARPASRRANSRASSSAKNKASTAMTGAPNGAARARISARATTSRPKPLRLRAPRQNRRRPNSSARNASRISAQIAARSPKAGSSSDGQTNERAGAAAAVQEGVVVDAAVHYDSPTRSQ